MLNQTHSGLGPLSLYRAHNLLLLLLLLKQLTLLQCFQLMKALDMYHLYLSARKAHF